MSELQESLPRLVGVDNGVFDVGDVSAFTVWAMVAASGELGGPLCVCMDCDWETE